MKQHIISITFRGETRSVLISAETNESGQLVISSKKLNEIVKKLFPQMIDGQTYTYG